MSDWKITNAIENQTGNWVYYIYTGAITALQNIHFSRHIDQIGEDHMATNDGNYYYYGFTGTFNTNDISEYIRDALVNAWNNYFQAG